MKGTNMYKKQFMIALFVGTASMISAESTLQEELRDSAHNFKRATSHVVDLTLAGAVIGGFCQALYHIIGDSNNTKKCNEGMSLAIGCLGLLFIKKNWNPDKEIYQQSKWFNAGLAQLMSAWGWDCWQPITLHATNSNILSGNDLQVEPFN